MLGIHPITISMLGIHPMKILVIVCILLDSFFIQFFPNDWNIFFI